MNILHMDSPGFDPVATDYDAQFTHTKVGRLQRAVVHRYLQGKIRPGVQVLELNCGTGEDALWLARQGCSVLATDSSPEMIRTTAAKIREANRQHLVQTQVLDIRQIDSRRSFAGRQFDLILSNFGGLNCLAPEELQMLGKQLPALLKPGGLFLAVIMGRFCWWETLYFTLKGQFREALRRWSSNPVEARLDAQTRISTWYYSPVAARAFFSRLKTQTIQPVGFWLPPSYLDPWFGRRPGLLHSLNFLEEKCRGQLWAYGADHFMGVFEHSTRPSPVS